MIPWTLVFHIIGLVFWLGSLLVVTQVLAIHAEESTEATRATLGRLETKLLRGLAHPGAAIMIITGIILVSREPQVVHEHWLQAKLCLVAVLIVLDLRLTFRARKFGKGAIELSHRECMVYHGAISLVFLAILVLVMVRPFGPRVAQARLGIMRTHTAANSGVVRLTTGG